MSIENKMHVMTVVGTRPEIIKLSQVIKELDLYVKHTIVHTGQNYDYELNELFFEQLDVRKPDIFLDAEKGSPSETIGDIIKKINDKAVKDSSDLFRILDTKNVGDSVSITVERNGKSKDFEVTLGALSE